MTARSGRDGHRSVEGERRRGPKDRGETECQGEGDGGHEGGHEILSQGGRRPGRRGQKTRSQKTANAKAATPGMAVRMRVMAEAT